MLKKYSTWFYMAYDEKGLVHISYSYLQLLIPPQLRNMTQRHKSLYGCKICTQDVTYQ